MERFKAIDDSFITQKENNPSLAKDGKDGAAREGNAVNFVPEQVGVTNPQQPLKIRNMAAQPQNQKQDQAQLLDKFRKLRQWQQQQQESMFRQQQQQMETLKMEQSKLQSILAAQRRLQEQRPTSSLSVRSPDLTTTSSQSDNVRQIPATAQSQLQQIARVQMPMSMTRAEIENNSNILPRTIPASSVPLATMSQRDLELQMRLAGSQQYNGATEMLQGSLTSFNETVYPMMWNSTNYRLPLGAIPLSSGPGPLQGQSVPGSTNSSNLVTNLGINAAEMTAVPSAFQSPVSMQELGRLGGCDYGTDSQGHFKMNANEGVNTTPYYLSGPGMTQELEGLWRHNPDLKSLADADSEVDKQSEVDSMSGVYPLYDSEPEMAINDMEEENEEDDRDAESEVEDELEETSERNTTVIELGACPEDGKGMNEKYPDKDNAKVDDEMPIKPGIGGTSSAKTFEELLEQQLKLDEASKAVPKPQSPIQKSQRTFLRKGQGLTRFKGKAAASKTGAQGQESSGLSGTMLQRKEKKAGNAVPTSSQGSNKPSVTIGVPVAHTRVTRKVASKSPQVVVTEAAEPTISGKPQQSRGSSSTKSQAANSEAQIVATKFMMPPSAIMTRPEESDPPSVLNSIDASFQMRLKELEEKHEMEEEELEEFELLEEAAANASFSSNSSVVVKVLAKARGNLQDIKNVTSGRGVDSANNRGPGGILSPVDTGYGSGDGKIVLSVDDLGQTDVENHRNELYENDSEDEESDVTLQEMSLDSALELDDGRDDKRQTAREQQKAPLYLNPTSSLAVEDDFNDEEAWGAIKKQAGTYAENINRIEDDSGDDDDDSDVTISDIFPLVTSTPPAHLKRGQPQKRTEPGADEADGLVASTPPTSALVTKLFPQLKPKQKAVPASKQAASDTPNAQSGKEKKEEPVDTIQSIAVREKLKELETEIEKFRTENAALAKMRCEREEGLKKLQSEIAAFEKQKTEELERLEQFREEELRKLRRERRVFEKYQKAARSMPDKKERDDIESLRGQVAELQEELKRRESRWSAASTRNRQRIEALEQQNKELQDEVKLLENYRLQQWREDEQTKAKEEEDLRPKKPLQRKTAKATEEESGPRLPLRHRSPPLRPALVEAVPRSTPENATVDPENRLLAGGIDTNNNQPTMPRQDEDASFDILSKSSEENAGIKSVAKPQEDLSQEIRKTKRSSPRRRSKTSDSGEKLKRSVHFQDEEKNDQNGPRESGNLNDRITRQVPKEIVHPDGKVEKVNSDGSRVITFANGTRKDISVDSQTTIVTFFNGDIKQIMPDQRVIYYYSDAQTTHTTYPDGLEVLQFPSKQIEKHYRDGTKEIIFPDQTIKYLYPNGSEECVFSDGTIQKVSVEGERTIEFPNGQRETHTKYYKKREYPDGTVKTVYPDGRTETRYSTGRVRVKDRDGRVLVDSSNQNR